MLKAPIMDPSKNPELAAELEGGGGPHPPPGGGPPMSDEPMIPPME